MREAKRNYIDVNRQNCRFHEQFLFRKKKIGDTNPLLILLQNTYRICRSHLSLIYYDVQYFRWLHSKASI